MLTEHTAAVRAICAETEIPTWPSIPENVAELPCIVVGRAALDVTENASVFQVSSETYIIGRSSSADDPFGEIERLADVLLDQFGDNLITQVDGLNVMVVSVDPATISVAGQEYPAALVAIESAHTKIG